MWWTLLACRAVSWSGDGPALLSVALSPVPNLLAVRVRFETDRPSLGSVEYGADGALEWQVTDPTLSMSHDLVVYGLPAGGTHRIDVVARGEDGGESRADPESWETPPLPSPALLGGEGTAGWTVSDLFLAEDQRNRAVMVDEAGRVVWWWEGDRGEGAGALDVRITPDGAILVGGSVAEGAHPVALDIAGEVLWEGPRQPDFDRTGYQHHHLEQLTDGSTVRIEKDVRDGVRGDRVVLSEPDGAERWSWSSWDWFDSAPLSGEQSHLNWVSVDGPWLFLSDFDTSQIWKVDVATGEPAWRLGWGGDFQLVGSAFFEQQHAPERDEGGWIYVYDNGLYPGPSRVVAYDLDEAARVATEAWSFDGDAAWSWFTGWWGGVDLLAGGNVLVSAGNAQVRRAMEVTPSKEVVWAIEWPEGAAFYRAERVDPGRWGRTPLLR